MKKRILIISSTNYQQIFSYLLSEFYKDDDIYLVSNAINPKINDNAKKLNLFKKVYVIERTVEYNSLRNYLKNYRLLNEVKNIVSYIKPTHIFIFNDENFIQRQAIKSGKKIEAKNILIQEGIEIYKEPKTVKTLYGYLKKILGAPNPFHDVQGETSILDKLIVGKPELIQPEKSLGKVIYKLPASSPPTEILKNYLELVIDPEILYYLRREYEYKKYILYVGQPLAERGFIQSAESEKERLLSIFNALTETEYELLIKPHPSEDKDKYRDLPGIVFENNDLPAELLPALIDIRAVITSTSFAAENLSFWNGINSYYVYKFLNDDNSRLNFETILNGEKPSTLKEMIISIENKREEVNKDENNIDYVEFFKNIIKER